MTRAHAASDLDARIDALAFTPFHRRLLLAGGLGYMFDAMDIAIVGFVLPVVVKAWSLGGGEAGLIAASSAIGGIFGALAAGRIGDVYGRRRVMMWALAIYASASLVSAFAWDWQAFLVARIVAGFGASAESVIIAPFLAEFAAARFRGRYVGFLTGFFSFGFVAGAVLGWSVVPNGSDGWRWALAITALPILMLLWWRRSIPESPRWLVQQGRFDEAEQVLRQMGSAGGGATAPGQAVRQPRPTTGQALDLLFRRLGGHALLVALLWGAIGFCYYAFMTWIPSLLIGRGMTMSHSFGYSIAIYTAQIPGYFSAGWLNDRIGSRQVIILYLGFGALAATALANAAVDAHILYASLLLSFAMNGAYAGLYSYTPELFPTAVRATAQGFAVGVSRIGAMVSPILIGLLFPAYGFSGVFGAAVLILGAASVLALLFGPQTRGRALGEISSLAKSRQGDMS